MKRFVAVCAIVWATHLGAQEQPDARPPVLRAAEPSDDQVITLPGAPPPAFVAVDRPSAPLTVAAPAPPALDAVEDHRPLLRRAPKPVFPAEFERDSAVFCQKLIGLWTHPDAYNLFGEPLRERVVMNDEDKESGRIYAFSDPTGRYREIELDFAKDTGTLRSVFVYPWKMTWTECRKIWGANVQSTAANKGRIFHSYVNRRLDVLVDPAGKVISLGLY
jgi:hypothetical protein